MISRAREPDTSKMRPKAFILSPYAPLADIVDSRAREPNSNQMSWTDLPLAPDLPLAGTIEEKPGFRARHERGVAGPPHHRTGSRTSLKQARRGGCDLEAGQAPPLTLIPEEGFRGNPTDRSFIESWLSI